MLTVIRHNEGEPRYQCLCCEALFFEGEERAFERHVAGSASTPGCAERNAERMDAESLRAKAPGIFDPNKSGDVELERWVRRNRTALLEDRLRI